MFAVAELDTESAPAVDRDEMWLRDQLDVLWSRYFADVPRLNEVRAEYASPWKTRLGLISLSEDESTTFIGINSLLRCLEVPSLITTVTIAHELAHYAHGFGSPLPRRYRFPHRGGVVARELFRRGLRTEFERYQSWIHERWYAFYEARERRSSLLAQSGPIAFPSAISRA